MRMVPDKRKGCRMFLSGVPIARAKLLLAVLIAVLIAVSGVRGWGADRLDSKWTLVWNDEFDGPDGSMPDPSKWSIVRDGSGFGNRELEYYTGLPTNLHIEGGNLIITARKETFKGADGVVRNYTSARHQKAR